eukprot:scaffold96247_cov60-Phaeocystis_antarctica.AAC.3
MPFLYSKRGVGAIPEVALWAIDRFVAVSSIPAVEQPGRVGDLDDGLHGRSRTRTVGLSAECQGRSRRSRLWPEPEASIVSED